MRRRAWAAASVGVALGAAALAVAWALAGATAAPERGGARLATTSASGSFGHSNSRDGLPLFTAAGIAPGHSTRGAVTLANTGALPGRFTLSAADVVDVPGHGGGTLSERLRLTVSDVTAPAQPHAIYDGTLASMPPRDLGVFAAGAERSFEFVVVLPDGGAPAGPGSGDDALQAAQTSVRYVWRAVEHGGATPIGDGVGPGGGAGPGPATRDRRSLALRLRVPRVQRILHRRYLALRVRCGEPCVARARAWMRAGRAGRVRLPPARSHARRGATAILRVRVPHRRRVAMRRALARGRSVTVRVVVVARDRSGNRAVAARTLRLRAR